MRRKSKCPAPVWNRTPAAQHGDTPALRELYQLATRCSNSNLMSWALQVDYTLCIAYSPPARAEDRKM
jgi:hypothetical protein